MYHVSAQGVGERVINVHYYYSMQQTRRVEIGAEKLDSGDQTTFVILMAEYGCTISLPLSVSYFVQLYISLIVVSPILYSYTSR